MSHVCSLLFLTLWFRWLLAVHTPGSRPSPFTAISLCCSTCWRWLPSSFLVILLAQSIEEHIGCPHPSSRPLRAWKVAKHVQIFIRLRISSWHGCPQHNAAQTNNTTGASVWSSRLHTKVLLIMRNVPEASWYIISIKIVCSQKAGIPCKQ